MKQLTRTLLSTVLLVVLAGLSPATAQEFPGAPDNTYVSEDETEAPPDRTNGPPRRADVSFTSGDGTAADIDEADAFDGSDRSVGDGVQTYAVKKGDTLGGISKKFYGTTKYWKKISSANGINNPAGMKVGRIIRIPSLGQGVTRRHRTPYVSADAAEPLPTAPPLPLPSASGGGGNETVLYSDRGMPQVYLPGVSRAQEENRHMVTFDGLTGLVNTFAAYPQGKGIFSTMFGVTWNKINRKYGHRLQAGEDGDYWSFPIGLTYSGENFEIAMKIPFESYDVYAPMTYNFRDGTDSGMGDAALRLKFSSQNDNMASCLGIGAIFPTSDRLIGDDTNDNAWEIFAGVSSKKKEGGNFHANAGYQAGDGNTAHEGVFFNVGFEYSANSSFNFMGEINSYNRINNGRSTDLTLGMRYYVKPGMALTLAAPIALSNDMFFGYDYRLMGSIQYNYGSGREPSYSPPSIPLLPPGAMGNSY